MLYKLAKSLGGASTFVPLRPTSMTSAGYPEKALEDWLARYPMAALPDEERVLVISQEKPFQDQTDILAVDEKGCAVVIELKRGLPSTKRCPTG